MKAEENKRMKVVWICHFLNDEIQDKLGVKNKNKSFAPWITLLLEIMENHPEVDLHVISPMRSINLYKTYKEKNVSYYFFNPGVPFKGTEWPFLLDYRTNFLLNRYLISKIVKKIEPDIVHLHGTENPYYSSAVLQLNKTYPTFVTIQGMITWLPKMEYAIKKRIEIEKEIIKLYDNFGIRSEQMQQDILSINPQANLFWNLYPIKVTDINEESIKNSPEKEYDLVFMARVIEEKGIEDLLWAVKEIKKQKPETKLLVLGPILNSYKNKLNNIVEEYNLKDNVEIKGFIPTQEEMHKLAKSAKLSVLPTKFDTIPGTILESIALELPVISYSTGGIPTLNEKDENIYLVERLNKEELVKKIVYALDNYTEAEEMARKAKVNLAGYFDNSKIFSDLFNIYKQILN